MAVQSQISPLGLGSFQQTQMLTLNEPEQQPIPLVGHIITDEDIGALQVYIPLVIGTMSRVVLMGCLFDVF